ncbi:hypothetical protein D9757_004130 [Collybiopsis confluens]|uniref:Uncharacterized protein n=1 Tax=Collybiopsis confluens TaxID=2823264 RepID=A0A8H5HUG1_9AGAR|nr:hypothetical protein D9757_004130 [Collybiopsis confluens]
MKNVATSALALLGFASDRPPSGKTPSGPVFEAGIGLGMSACADTCPSPTTVFQHLFYAGGFNPQRPSNPAPGEDFNAFQNFTVTVPSITGHAILGFLHSSFGEEADLSVTPFFESVNITVNVVEAS